MAALFPSHPDGRDSTKFFRASESCSVCLEAVSDSGERSIAKLKCGHHFHLDCIGSAFNAKGAMQCPNCRHVEDGQWLYANGSRWTDDFHIDEIAYEDDYEVYQAMPDLVAAALEEFPSVQNWGHVEWCPLQPGSPHAGGSSYPHIQVSVGDSDGAGGFPEVVLNVLYNGGASSTAPICPHLAAQGLRAPRQSQVPEDSHMRPPVAHGPLRLPDMLATSNGGGMTGEGVGLFSSQNREIWGRRNTGMSSSPGYNDAPGASPSLADPPRFFPDVDVLWNPRSPQTSWLYGDGGMVGLSPQDRHRSSSRPDNTWSRPDGSWSRADNPWTRADTERSPSLVGHTHSTYGPLPAAQYGYGGSHVDGGTSPASQGTSPCPRPQYMYGQVGSSHSPPQSTSIRSGPIGSGRRLRHSGIPLMSGTRVGPNQISEELNRRISQYWSERPVSQGQEPPVPGLEPHGPSYYGDSHNWPSWRRDMVSGTSTSAAPSTGNPEPHWRAWMSSVDFRHGDFASVADGHGGTSRLPRDGQFELFRSSLNMNYAPPLGREGTTEVGNLSSHNLRQQR